MVSSQSLGHGLDTIPLGPFVNVGKVAAGATSGLRPYGTSLSLVSLTVFPYDGQLVGAVVYSNDADGPITQGNVQIQVRIGSSGSYQTIYTLTSADVSGGANKALTRSLAIPIPNAQVPLIAGRTVDLRAIASADLLPAAGLQMTAILYFRVNPLI